MRIPAIFYSSSVRMYQRKSVLKIYRKTENGWKVLDNVSKNEIPKAATNNHNQNKAPQENKSQTENLSKEEQNNAQASSCRENEMKIQMLSKSLYDQIFKNNQRIRPDEQTIQK